MSYRGFKRWKSDTYTRTHTHTSGRQLKITSLDVLDYSEYSDTNISKFFFHENIASSVRKQNYSKFELKIFQLLKNFKKPKIFKSQYIKKIEFSIFEVLNLLYLRFYNFIIFGLLNFQNIEIPTLELTWQSISDRSSQF